MDVELWDLAAAGGAGAKIGSAEVALDLAEFQPFAGQAAAVTITGRDGQVRGSSYLCEALQQLVDHHMHVPPHVPSMFILRRRGAVRYFCWMWCLWPQNIIIY